MHIIETHESLRDFLKNSTRRAHNKVEEAMGILDPNLSEGRYRQILLNFRNFHAAFEEKLRGRSGHCTATDFYLPQRSKLAWLEADLGSVPAEKPMSMDWIKTEADVWGVLYVLEGSTLGGTQIVKFLKLNPKHARRPMQFFAGYEARTGMMWSEFLNALESLPRHCWLQCQHSAEQTFALLTEELRKKM
jgi:heme oxygenase (biliverdin-IX-beta and delta-forming)